MWRSGGVVRRLLVLAVSAAALSGACSSIPAPTIGATPGPTFAETSGPGATAPATTAAAPIDVETLPMAQPDPAVLTAVCDAPPGIMFPGAGDTAFPCADGIRTGYRVLAALAGTPTRMRLAYPACASAPCSRDALSTATVSGWIGSSPWSIVLRVDQSGVVTATAPARGADAAWPTVDAAVAAVARPAIDGAPQEVARREAYPFCGTIAPGADPQLLPAWRCFAAATLAGRRAELAVHPVATEGAPLVELLRFGGEGSPVAYTGAGGSWSVSRVALVMPASDTLPWGSDPLGDTAPVP